MRPMFDIFYLSNIQRNPVRILMRNRRDDSFFAVHQGEFRGDGVPGGSSQVTIQNC